MSLPVIAVITSAQCGHCVAMRGNGQPKQPKLNMAGLPLSPGRIKGGHHWSPSFFESLIRGGVPGGPPKFRVIEFHFPTLGPRSLEDVQEVNYFVLNRQGKVDRITYTPSRNGVMIQVNGGKKSPKAGITFHQFMGKFPRDLIKYLYIYPGWVIADGAIWDGATTGTNRLYAQALSCTVTEFMDENGEKAWKVDYSMNPSELVDPLAYIKGLSPDLSELHPKVVKINTPLPEMKEDRVQSGSCSNLNFRLVGFS